MRTLLALLHLCRPAGPSWQIVSAQQAGPPRPELGSEAAQEWRRRHGADLANLRSLGASGQRCPLVLLGDSITEGWARPYFRQRGPWPPPCAAPCGPGSPALGRLVPGSGAGGTAAIFAVGGDRTEDLAWRLFKDGGATALRSCKPRAVVLLVGTNDFSRGDDIGVAAAELLHLARELRGALDHGTHLVLHGLLPRATYSRGSVGVAAPWDDSNPEFRFLSRLSGALRGYAAEAGNGSVSFAECGDALLREGRLSWEVFPDLLHPSEQGYLAWSSCLVGHLQRAVWSGASQQLAVEMIASRTANGSQLALVPQMASVPVAADGGLGPVEVLWQRPRGAAVRAVTLLLHGCAHQGTDFWPRDGCSRCQGLPEEVRIVRAVLARGFVAVAVTSVDRSSGCWSLEDLQRVEEAVAHVYRAEALAPSVPLYAFGASSGGAFVGRLADTPSLGRNLLKCRIPQIMGTPGTPQFTATLEAGGEVTWPAPPTLFIHMPVDLRTAARVEAALAELRRGNVTAAELRCEPMALGEEFFSSRVEGVTATQSKALAQALRKGGFLSAAGMLLADPRASDDWRSALMETGVPDALQDTLEPDGSRLNEEMNVAWAKHEMCATFAEEMLDFCEDPQGACAKHKWTCTGKGQ